MLVMSCFYGKDGIVYGKVRLELVMSQSHRVPVLYVYKDTKHGVDVSVGVICHAWMR